MKRLLALSLLFILFSPAYAGTKSDSVTLRPNMQKSNEVTVVSDGQFDTTSINILAAVWTIGGSHAVWRNYIKFDLSSIPDSAVVDSAYLSLYADSASHYGFTGSPTYGTANAGTIYRVKSAWTKASLRWNTQPAYTSKDSVVLAQSSTVMDNYVKKNVTKLVQAMVDSGNHGFLLKHQQEATYYNSLIFHASRAADSMKRPTLKVYYRYNVKDTAVYVSSVKLVEPVDVFPNPTTGRCTVTIAKDEAERVGLVVMDVTGKVVFNQAYNVAGSKMDISLDLSNEPKGMYFLKILIDDVDVAQQKLIRY